MGPISLPAPVRDFQLRPDFAVVHYWNDTGVWRHWFVPGLHESFGTLWPLTLAGMLAVAVFAIWRGREPILRVLGAFVLVTAVAYVFTPLTAAGEQGQPIAFVWNVRYLAPAVAVGLAILPCLPALRATPAAPGGGAGRRSPCVLAFTVGSLVQWQQGHVKGAVGRRRCSCSPSPRWSPVLRSRGRARARPPAGAFGWRWRRPRWSSASPPATASSATTSPTATRTPARSRTSPTRCAGRATCATRGSPSPASAAVFTQYPFYGTDLSNRVQWLGVRGPHDSYQRIPNCRAVAAGDQRRRLHARRHHLRPLPAR